MHDSQEAGPSNADVSDEEKPLIYLTSRGKRKAPPPKAQPPKRPALAPPDTSKLKALFKKGYGNLKRGLGIKRVQGTTVKNLEIHTSKTAFKVDNEYEAYEQHYRMYFKDTRKSKHHSVPLLETVQDDFFAAMMEILEELKKTFPHQAFLLTLTHNDLKPQIDGPVWFFDGNLTHVIHYYSEYLANVMTSKRALKADSSMEAYFWVFCKKRISDLTESAKRDLANISNHGDLTSRNGQNPQDAEDEEADESERIEDDEFDDNELLDSIQNHETNNPVLSSISNHGNGEQSSGDASVEILEPKVGQKKAGGNQEEVYLEIPNEEDFEKLCLPIAAIIGAAHRSTDPGAGKKVNNWKNLRKLYSAYNTPTERALAKRLIKDEYDNLCNNQRNGHVLRDLQNMSLNVCLPVLADAYECDFIVMNNINNEAGISYMSGPINYQRPRVYLFQTLLKDWETGTLTGHCRAIKLVKAFWRKYGKFK